MPRLFARVAVSMTAVAALVALAAPPASGVAIPSPPGGTPRANAPTQMTMDGTGSGQAVKGFIANAGTVFDPVTDGYPTSNPTTGWSTKNEGFAGIIFGKPADGSPQMKLYCFDINTNTQKGINYILGTWNASNVPNVNYVAQVLNNYYPKTNEPAALTNLNQKAAAVQAAIWFFSDRYVLNTSDALRPTVESIVNDVIARGPAPPPTPPSVNITPDTVSGTESILGPFTVTATGPATSATVTAVGADMFKDAAATQPIAPGTAVPSGTKIWLKKAASNTTNAAELLATAKATVPQNNVYLYDHTNSGVKDAQRLILAQDATLTTTVTGDALFTETGSLIVQKTIAGTAAGRQGDVTILVSCGGVLVGDPFVIAAKTPAGTKSLEYKNIPVGTKCTVTEQHDGSSSSVAVEVAGSGQEVTIPSGKITATITDTYKFTNPGTLVVKKSIKGPAAGSQGEVVIQPTCDGTKLNPFRIPAGHDVGQEEKIYSGLAPGSVCTVTETSNGQTNTVTVTVDPSTPQTVTVPGGGTAQVGITDTYTAAPGSLVVTKTIAGPAAGQQGTVTIGVICNEGGTNVPLPDFTIDANAPAGEQSHTYPDIPAGSLCTVTETSDGNSSTVSVIVEGSGQQVSIPPGAPATADLTDTYTLVPGSLVVTKSIAGEGAGLQDDIVIQPICGGKPLPEFRITAGAPAGSVDKTYNNIPAGTSCTVTETSNGANGQVTVTVDGGGQVTVPAGKVVSSDFTDTYELKPGSLTVNKTIAGPGAGRQGQIVITVSCVHDGATTPYGPFTIPAGTPAGTKSFTIDDIAGDSVCTVTETADGHSTTLAVRKRGSGQEVTIPPGGSETANLTDTYLTGSLVVNKTITGDAAGSQGDVTIETVCNGTHELPDLFIPAGSPAGSYPQAYNVLAPATCTVTETAAGGTSTVNVVTVGSPQDVTLSPDGTGTANLTDTYTFVPGSLTVTKTIAGPSAGSQDEVRIQVDCGEQVDTPDFVIPAGATGPQARTYTGIPANTTCTVTETADGATQTVAVTTTGSPQDVTVGANATATADITDTYTAAPGALRVQKTIAGTAAGSQDAVIIHVVCDGTALKPDFTIPAGTAAGATSTTYNDIPAGSTCTVTETSDGSSSTVTVTTDGDGQDVTVPAGGVVAADLLDTYAFVPGSLTVTKHISGPAAGSQGAITIGVNCEGLALDDFVIPAGATGAPSHAYDNIPAGLTCTVAESSDGSSTTVQVVTTGSPQDVKINPAATSTADITDTYGPVPGSLVVSKTINGPSAGSQGAITIDVKCGTSALPAFTIPAGTPAKTVTHTYHDIPGGSSCTITETSDGATKTVQATVVGGTQTLTVPAAVTQTASITDTYSPAPGTVIVTKRLAGVAAGQQGLVGILVVCGKPLQVFAVVIPAKHAAGPVTQGFNGVGGGSRCLVAEVIDGHTGDLTVAAIGGRQRVTVPAAGVASVHMTDRFGVEALAVTGPRAAITPLIGIALAAILAGAGAMMLGRRRRS